MNLDIIPNGAIKRVHISQNDVGRTLTFNLFNGSTQYTIPVGATVKIQGTKPSGFGFSETCSVSGNVVTVDTTETMTDEYGYIETELVIDDGTDVLGTANFILAIEKNPHPSNTTDGTQITAQSLEVRIEALEESALGGLTDEAKQALLNCFAHVAWIDEDGQDYYDALEDALYPPATLTSISAVYTQSGTVYDTDSLDDLKADLVVTAHYDNGTTQTVTTYTLSGTLTEGTSVITVSYGGFTTTFNVTVTEYVIPSEVLQYAGSNTTIDFTTFEDSTTANYWRFGAGTLKANKLRFTWNSAECNGFQIVIAQYDSSGNPYKLSNVQSYSSAPTTDGADINDWADAGTYKYTAIGGGNIVVSLPTTGLVKVVTRKSSGSGTAVTDNATYQTWLANGGLTITAIQE